MALLHFTCLGTAPLSTVYLPRRARWCQLSHPAQALMGPSGAGKSTLMDILAQRKTVGHLSGFLLVNGQPATDKFVRKTAYVPQVSTWPRIPQLLPCALCGLASRP